MLAFLLFPDGRLQRAQAPRTMLWPLIVIVLVVLIYLRVWKRKVMGQRHSKFKLKPVHKFKRTVPNPPDASVPLPGQLLVHDFRDADVKAAAASSTASSIRVLAWNIERGFKLGDIIACLKKENADILLLTEVDIGCHRTAGLDVGAEIASALKMQLVFGADMRRAARHQLVAVHAARAVQKREHLRRKQSGRRQRSLAQLRRRWRGSARHRGQRDSEPLRHRAELGGRAAVRALDVRDLPRAQKEAHVSRCAHHGSRVQALCRMLADECTQTPIGPVACYAAHFDAFSGALLME